MNKNDALHTHLWSDGSGRSTLDLYGKSGRCDPLHHRVLVVCQRDFAQGFNGTYDWEAAYIRVIGVELLGTAVNERWRNRPCPGAPLPGDDADRATRRS